MAERVGAHELTALVAGGLFAAGLGVSGMTDPAKVRAFLDLGGAWDPTLLLVMGAAVAVHAIGWWALRRRGRPLLDGSVPTPPSRFIDPRLVGGSALFGVGWGLAGACPGPALVNLAAGGGTGWFVTAMVGGIALGGLATKRSRQAPMGRLPSAASKRRATAVSRQAALHAIRPWGARSAASAKRAQVTQRSRVHRTGSRPRGR